MYGYVLYATNKRDLRLQVSKQPLNFEYCGLFVQILTILRRTVVTHFKRDTEFNWNIQISGQPYHVLSQTWTMGAIKSEIRLL